MSLESISNFIRVDGRLGTSNQPFKQEFNHIEGGVFETLINLTKPDSTGTVLNEGETSLGMSYVHIPVLWDEPKISDRDQFMALLTTSERHRQVHCVVSTRVPAFTYIATSIWAPIRLKPRAG